MVISGCRYSFSTKADLDEKVNKPPATLDLTRLSIPQRTFLAAGSAALGLMNTHRGDLIGTLGEVTGGPSLSRLLQRMRESEEGCSILEEKPRIRTSELPLEKMRNLSEISFGRVYVEWMDSHGYSPDDRSPVRFLDGDEAYVMARYREIHDFIHVLVGLPPTVEGEIAQKVSQLAVFLRRCVFSWFPSSLFYFILKGYREC